MKRSLRTRMFSALTACIIFVVGFCVFFNYVVLGQIYLKEKENTLIESMQKVNNLYLDEDVDESERRLEFERMNNDQSIHMTILNLDKQVVYTTLPPNTVRMDEDAIVSPELEEGASSPLAALLLDAPDPKPPEADGKFRTERGFAREELRGGENYSIYRMYNAALHAQSLELIGTLDNGNELRMQLAIAPIEESVRLTTRVWILIGLFVIFAGGGLAYFFSRRFTKPILELSDIAKKMTDMDFDCRYSGENKDEIGQLGESLNTLAAELQRSITELKQANQKLQQDIKQKVELDKKRTEFLSNISHELKTPIALIEAYAEGLNENVALDDEERKYYCEVILDESRKMSIMIRKVMSLTQMENGKERIDISKYDIVEQLHAVVNRKSILFEEKGIAVQVKNTEPIYVWADEFWIEDVLVNYLTNALKYGEKYICVWAEKRSSGLVRVSVFNRGPHIPENELAHIWDSFYMLDKARTRDSGSQGLGLSVVSAVMRAHNRSCGVENVKDGVTFWFEVDSV